jgi:2-phospho-L-lactate transferase/gluconeogenesis factor (CofD/UPF0052 family)
VTPRGRSAGPGSSGPRVVALGGGHGLAATLRALRRVTDDVTAVVAVSDDGGSSGRLRQEFDVVPPGDLRMALAALCGDDTWGRTWSRVVQHRFAGTGDLAGHSLGNLLITALWEETGDIVTGLDWVAALLGAHGRVLPVATVPLQVVAEVRGLHPDDPSVVERVEGQVEVATTPGDVVSAAPRARRTLSRCPECSRGDHRGRRDRAGSRVVVHQRAGPAAGSAASGRRSPSAHGPGGSCGPQPGAAAGGD